jgi:hypothetical protein
MIKIDLIMSELWYIVLKKYNLRLVYLLIVLCEMFINEQKLITLPFKSAQFRLFPWLIWQLHILVSVLQPTNEEWRKIHYSLITNEIPFQWANACINILIGNLKY